VGTSERINAAIAIFTALYLIVTFFILLATLRANRQSRENATANERSTQVALEMTRDSNALTRESIEVAKQTLELSRHAFELSVRPDLYVGPFEQEDSLQRLTFRVSIANRGGAAYELRVLDGTEIRPRDQPLTLEALEEPSGQGAVGRGSLGRGDAIRLQHSIDAWNTVLLRLRGGEQILYFFVTVAYRDVLDRRFHARFLHRYNATHSDWPAVGG